MLFQTAVQKMKNGKRKRNAIFLPDDQSSILLFHFSTLIGYSNIVNVIYLFTPHSCPKILTELSIFQIIRIFSSM